jgi:hypothetical protein
MELVKGWKDAQLGKGDVERLISDVGEYGYGIGERMCNVRREIESISSTNKSSMAIFELYIRMNSDT